LSKSKVNLALTLALLLALSSLVYAAYWIYSNTVTVTVTAYALTLDVDKISVVQYENITLTATLKLGDTPQADKTIYFFMNDTEIGFATTDSSGVASLQYNCTQTGTLTFKAGYQVP